ncbi:MAG: hypothetical protein NZ805_11435 [Armatimonadetes bacterium]|nr:hypothetical protein [Armatimonadota bacterium]MDW8028448.1 hypothetical protein [Armatimonadota bacterium]
MSGRKHKVIGLTEAEIEEIYNNIIVPYYERYLRSKGVKLPRLRKTGRPTKDALTLVYLARNYPNTQWVTKAELTEFIRQFYPETPDVQSGRHLGMQNGFYIVSTRRGNADVPDELRGLDAYRLVSLEQAHPSFRPKRQKVTDWDFGKLKKEYNYRCATCGSKEGEVNLRYPKVITKLQQGHMNPHKPLELGNIIPQCDMCNRADRGKWVYDKRGRVIGVAETKIIIQSIQKGYLTEEEQLRLYEFLKGKFERGERR